MKELQSLCVHIIRGCLSDIPPSVGTNCNEQLHSCINPFFRWCRMGIVLDLVLLAILFHEHNKKITGVESHSILSTRAAYKCDGDHISNSCPRFGILKKTSTPDIDCWIFCPEIHDNLPEVSIDQLCEFDVSPNIEIVQLYMRILLCPI